MSLVKKALIAVAIVIVVTLLSLTLAYKLIDDSVIERNALKALQDTLKRDVTIDGEFTLSRSLHPMLRTTGVRIASADWDAGNALLEADTLEIGIALLDLLTANITINTIVFENAIINIKRNAEGQSNLEFSSEPATKESSSKTTGAPIDVIDVKINNLTVNYSDQQSGNAFVYALDTFSLEPKNKDVINISASSRFDEQPIALESEMCRIRHLLKGENCSLTANVDTHPFETKLKGVVNIANQGMLDIKIDAVADNINELALLKDTSIPDTEKIEINTAIKGRFNQIALNNLNTSVKLENTTVKATGEITSINTLEGLDISVTAEASEPAWIDAYQDILSSEFINDFKLTAAVQGDQDAFAVNNITADLELPDTKIKANGEATIQPELLFSMSIDANGKHPAWLDELQQAITAEEIDDFTLSAQVDNQAGAYNIRQLATDISINDTATSAQGEISIDANNAIIIDLALKSDGSNLQDFEKVIQQSLPKSDNYALETLFNFKNNTINLSQLALTIDETKLQGNSTIELLSPPNIQADINADTLNVEHLLATLGASESSDGNNTNEETESDDKAASLFSDNPIELDWLSSADTNVLLTINNLVYKDATLNDVKASAVAKNNIATLDISSLKYQDANITSKSSVDANNHTYNYQLFTENFDLGKLLNETDISETLEGKIDASVDINSTGKTSKQLAHNATGKLTTVMTQGSLADAPIDLLASNLLVELMPGKSKKDTTKIECMFVQFSGENGIFNSDAALLNTENIVMTTNGSIDLTDESLNLLLVPKPKNIELFTLDANIRVSGNINDPSFSLDKGSVFKKLLKSAATVALGPAALAVPFTNMGDGKSQKCFSEVASVTTKAVEAQQEAERLAREQAEKERLEKELQEKAAKEAVVEPLDP